MPFNDLIQQPKAPIVVDINITEQTIGPSTSSLPLEKIQAIFLKHVSHVLYLLATEHKAAHYIMITNKNEIIQLPCNNLVSKPRQS